MRLSVLGFLTVISLTSAHSLWAQVPEEVAWNVLEKGHKSHNTKERINAVRALGQLLDNHRAVECINDKKPDVRSEAALTLGRLNSVRSIPLLKNALKDKSIQVDFAASNLAFSR